MGIFKDRFNSWGEVITLYVACSFPIFVWAIGNTLFMVSQWILRLTLWETFGAIAYVLGGAFIESLIVFLIVMGVVLILPARWFNRRTIPLTAAFLSLTMALVIYLKVVEGTQLVNGVFTGSLIALAVYVLLLVVAYVVIRRSERLTGIVNSIIERLVPLSLVYTFVGLVGVILVIFRNLSA